MVAYWLNLLYISISLAGITHGSLTFAPLYCRYYYCVNDLGTVLGFLTTGNAIGSILIATLIFPHYYHSNSNIIVIIMKNIVLVKDVSEKVI